MDAEIKAHIPGIDQLISEYASVSDSVLSIHSIALLYFAFAVRIYLTLYGSRMMLYPISYRYHQRIWMLIPSRDI